MSRNHVRHAEDKIRKYATLIKEYIANGEAFLGDCPRASVNGYNAKLRYLKDWAYNVMIGGYDDGTGGRTWIVLQNTDVQLEWEPRPDSFTGQKMVAIYWRPNRIWRERARLGLSVPELSPEDQEALDEAREWLLKNL